MMLSTKPKIELSGDIEKIDAITEQLCEFAKPYQSRCIVILDPFISVLEDKIIQFFYKKFKITQVKIKHPSVLAWQRPLLLALNLKDTFERDVLRYTIDQALSELNPQNLCKNGTRHYSGWVFTHSNIQNIAEDFAYLSLQKIYKTNQLLRFYDPAVLPQLLTILNTQLQIKLLGHIEIWTLLDGNGDLFYRHNDQPSMVYTGQLGITKQLEQEINCIGINNQFLKKYRKTHPLEKINECESLNKIKPCLLRLMSRGFTDNALLVEWAKVAYMWGKDFDLHPYVQNKIQNMKTRFDFTTLLNKINSPDWQIILNQDLSEQKNK
ncbi:hypothetical protein [Gilliamella apicola]|uniref:hypothetical protein n=3 Tax=Gilliamella apicola TaxID=1196095 RepID=UPI0015C4F8C9|nr:hypothetical protein [Gilliamella apicola]